MLPIPLESPLIGSNHSNLTWNYERKLNLKENQIQFDDKSLTSQAGLVRIDFLFDACCLCAVARFDVDFVLPKLNRFNEEIDADDLRLKLDIIFIFLNKYLMSISIQLIFQYVKNKIFENEDFEKI